MVVLHKAFFLCRLKVASTPRADKATTVMHRDAYTMLHACWLTLFFLVPAFMFCAMGLCLSLVPSNLTRPDIMVCGSICFFRQHPLHCITFVLLASVMWQIGPHLHVRFKLSRSHR